MAMLRHSVPDDTTRQTVGEPALSPPARSIASIFAILAALLSFWLSANDHRVWGVLLALLAIASGLLGGVAALSPRVKGGLLSIAAVVLGTLAILAALISMLTGTGSNAPARTGTDNTRVVTPPR